MEIDVSIYKNRTLSYFSVELSDRLKEPTNARIIWLLRTSPMRYSGILNALGERDSGKLNYHLKRLAAAGLIKKDDTQYALTRTGLRHALYVDSLQLKERYPLPVVVVAVIKGRAILLAKRCRDPCNGMWGLPGNELLYGESPEEAASKELLEELGIRMSAGTFYGAYPTLYREHGELLYHVILLAVRAQAGPIPREGRAKGKISEYRFFTQRQLERLDIVPSNKQPILDALAGRQALLDQRL